jgi:hypothetical protein
VRWKAGVEDLAGMGPGVSSTSAVFSCLIQLTATLLGWLREAIVWRLAVELREECMTLLLHTKGMCRSDKLSQVTVSNPNMGCGG